MMVFGAVQAQAKSPTYYADVSLSQSWDQDSHESGRHDKKESTDISGTLYFEPVSMDKGPFAEAAFLSKASSAEIGSWHDGKTRDRDGHDDLNYPDIDITYLKGQYVTPGSNIVLQAMYGRAQESVDAHVEQLGLGAYITDNAALTIDYERFKNDELDDDFNTIKSWTLAYRQLINIFDNQYVVVEPHIRSGEYYDGEDTFEAGFETAWYFTKALGLRAGYDHYAQKAPGPDIKTKDYFVGADYFVTEDIRIGAVVKKLEVKDLGNEDNDQQGAELYVSLLVK